MVVRVFFAYNSDFYVRSADSTFWLDWSLLVLSGAMDVLLFTNSFRPLISDYESYVQEVVKGNCVDSETGVVAAECAARDSVDELCKQGQEFGWDGLPCL